MTTIELEKPRPWGTSTKAWGPRDIARWWSEQIAVRSYEDDVLARLSNLPSSISVESYGPPESEYRRIRVGSWDTRKPKILITGGVHGYEVGGVHGAITFAEKFAPKLVKDFDFAIYPCINPLAFRFDIRWNAQAQDTNRHFCRDPSLTESHRSAPENIAFMNSVDELGDNFILAIDLHETTDRDLELRQLKIFRDGGTGPANKIIPQGFYLVMNLGDENSSIGTRVIESVRNATKIADEPIILGVENRNGIVHLDGNKYPGLCMNYTGAKYKLTTEVYPDIITREEALDAQTSAIWGALEYLRCDIK